MFHFSYFSKGFSQPARKYSTSIKFGCISIGHGIDFDSRVFRTLKKWARLDISFFIIFTDSEDQPISKYFLKVSDDQRK